jgi:tetratricopeptide (TPR) repeat protein
VATRLESQGEWQGLLEHLDRVIAREEGLRQAEARLWRAAFAGRIGLHDIAAAVCDSLLEEGANWPSRFRCAAAGLAFDQYVLLQRHEKAIEALDLWRECRWDSLPDSVRQVQEAGMRSRLGRLCLAGNRDLERARREFQAALSLPLPDSMHVACRLGLGQALAGLDSSAAAIDVFHRLLAEEDRIRKFPEAAYRASMELADLLYGAGRHDEARSWYESLRATAMSPGDSGWVVVQLGDVSSFLGAWSAARGYYDEYLTRWPDGVWAAWVKSSAAEIDSTWTDEDLTFFETEALP